MKIKTGCFFFLFFCFLILVILIGLISYEIRTSRIQSLILSNFTEKIAFWLEPGISNTIRFPETGPYDKQLGYVSIPAFTKKLAEKGYTVASQAQLSKNFLTLWDFGLFPVYHEKIQTGLVLLDKNEQSLFKSVYPERIYEKFDNIPGLIVSTLLFIENRELLNNKYPYKNPAVEWDRLSRAVLNMGLNFIRKDQNVPGGSTLLTQIEKFRHSPDGLTTSPGEKIKQIASASLRSYLDGRETHDIKRQIVLDYLNSLPLGAAQGYGEVNGLGDGLWAWYGVDFDSFNLLLQKRLNEIDESQKKDWGLAYKQMISLFLAQRKPSYYLIESHSSLIDKIESYLKLVRDAGIITGEEHQYASNASITFHTKSPAQFDVQFVNRKAANAIRTRLLSFLGISEFYELNRLDLTVKSSLENKSQSEISSILQDISDSDKAEQAGLNAFRLLEYGDPKNVIYSFTLYECCEGANLLRIQTDTYNQPFNINEGIKLELGSSAKLRTLVNYLEIIAELHERFSHLSKEELNSLPVVDFDILSRWAVDFFRYSNDKSLAAILNAAMKRNYSANPGEQFFTGGGLHTFANFNDEDDVKTLSVEDAIHNSVNLVFIRLMRDIVHYYTYKRHGSREVLKELAFDKRTEYLKRFADQEGREFLNKFYKIYSGKSFEESMELLLNGVKLNPVRLAVIHRSIFPEASVQEFSRFIQLKLPNSSLSDKTLNDFFNRYSVSSFSLVDRGYIARIHPLELWLVSYLRMHPDAGKTEIMEKSIEQRQEVYTWLFKTRNKSKQDKRIKSILELEAFKDIQQAWKRLGYPFDSLVPSYATAIGSSADRPVALAELVGIILRNGRYYPSVRILNLQFAKDTPYETIVKKEVDSGEQVLLPEIAAVVKNALIGVVENGTAQRIKGAFVRSDKSKITVGGKTGTGDNRFDVFSPGGNLISSQSINRTATFVFFIGDHFFGTITAYVGGKESGNYGFTSSLPLQVLKNLAPQIIPMIENAETEHGTFDTQIQTTFKPQKTASSDSIH